MRIFGVIMAGGGGTRFWPVSTMSRPKQLLSLSGKNAMINETADRLLRVTDKKSLLAVTNSAQAGSLTEITAGRIYKENVLSEPLARNTSACIGYAAAVIKKKYGDGIMIVSPSDAFVKDEKEYARVLSAAAVRAEKGGIVTVGITPTFPATGYGYIRYEKGEGEAKKVLRFVEKPDFARAKEYFESGEYVWNSGVFVFRAGVILEEMKKHIPKVYAGVEKIYEAAGTENEKNAVREAYNDMPSVSVDYGVMEKAEDISVIPASFGWNDVGSWDMLSVFHEADEKGNISVGDCVLKDCEGVTSYSSGRLVAALGVKDIVIAETPYAVLVIDKNRVQEVKKITDELKNKGRTDLL